jgi:hypothetical protein
MNILVVRRYKLASRTLGSLSVDGEYICDTLEDVDRGLTSEMKLAELKTLKVKAETAIPTGTYVVDMNTVSPKYKERETYKFIDGKVPRLMNVPAYEGVLIHAGNSEDDTEGCVLVGRMNADLNAALGILNSVDAFKRLMAKLQTRKEDEKITITIK